MFNFVFCQRWDRQEAFFGDIFPQKAEPQHRSQRAFHSECSSEPSLTVFPLELKTCLFTQQKEQTYIQGSSQNKLMLPNSPLNIIACMHRSLQGLNFRDWAGNK